MRRVDPNAISVEIIGTQVEGIMSKYDQVFGENYQLMIKSKCMYKKLEQQTKEAHKFMLVEVHHILLKTV